MQTQVRILYICSSVIFHLSFIEFESAEIEENQEKRSFSKLVRRVAECVSQPSFRKNKIDFGVLVAVCICV